VHTKHPSQPRWNVIAYIKPTKSHCAITCTSLHSESPPPTVSRIADRELEGREQGVDATDIAAGPAKVETLRCIVGGLNT
jgi:hypothetical protein